MREPDIRALIKDVVGINTKMEYQGGWVMLRCPLARWTHDRGTDNKPSFGVSIHNDDSSHFNCFTCHNKGPLSKFLLLMEKYTGEDWGKLIESLEKDEAYQAELPEWDDCRQLQRYEKTEPLPEHFEDLYEPMEGIHPYLLERGIQSEEAVATARLKIDPDNKGVERVVFPVYGLDGGLYGFTGRAVSDKIDPKVRDYHGLQKKQFLLGLQNITSETEFVILVEGLLDYLHLLQLGYTALAVMHSGLTLDQADILKEIGKPVYLMFDNDTAGRTGTSIAKELLIGHVPVMSCTYPDEDDNSPADPAELYPEELELMLEGAEIC